MELALVSGLVGIYFCVSCVGASSGAALNPLIGFVNLTFVAIVRSGTGERNYLEYLPSYLLATSLGGILAGLFCKYLVMPLVPNYHETLQESVTIEYSKKQSIINRPKINDPSDLGSESEFSEF
jgi:hypothetical protein